MLDLEDINIYIYPSNLEAFERNNFLQTLIYENEERKATLQKKFRIQGKKGYHPTRPQNYSIKKPIAQDMDGLNIYSTLIDGNIIMGLILEDNDNPYDYEDAFLECLHEHLNNITPTSLEKEDEIENLLISVFIDIRRFSDEIINKKPQIEYESQKILRERFFKVFLFGIDDSGKTSLIRRLKFDKFNHNYFTPSKQFNIEYVKHKKGLLAWWDMPGQQVYREKWLLGAQDANIYVYLIDIANQRRFKEVKLEFWSFMKKRKLDKVPLLILGNKLDLINYLSGHEKNEAQLRVLRQEILEYFEFKKIDDRDWDFFFISVKTKYNISKISDAIFQLIHL
ncbi:MAG: GTP-binding protein [Promethearchaeota archaeon]|nr:MAG: GTP-binding protein [Candidatus Lokiarchaeota archaeon]